MTANKEAFDRARLNPKSVFHAPEEVTASPLFSLEQKIEILRNWAYDANELSVAEEENMGGGEPAMLDRVLTELNRLAGGYDTSKSSPTKQGGISRDSIGRKK